MFCLSIIVNMPLSMVFCIIFFFKQKTAYEMRISDWSSDVCSSDLGPEFPEREQQPVGEVFGQPAQPRERRVDPALEREEARQPRGDRKRVVSGKSVSVRVDLGGRRIIKKKNKTK